MFTRIPTMVSTLAVTAGLTAGTIGSAAVANATREQDVKYIDLLASHEITVTDRAAAIKNEYIMCAMLDEAERL